MIKVKHEGLVYEWENNKFLTHSQVKYSLERLWSLIAGDASTKWHQHKYITISAVTDKEVNNFINLPNESLEWIELSKVLPSNSLLNIDTNRLPALFSTSSLEFFKFTGTQIFPIDLITATFILLTRWEEWRYPDLDSYGRHKEDATICARQNFRDRPVLDEWALTLRHWFQKWDPKWAPSFTEPRIAISHDIDHLFYYKSNLRVIKAVIKGIVKQRSLVAALYNLKEGLIALKYPFKDPCYAAIKELAQMDEKIGLKGDFYFMTSEESKYDEGYDLSSDLGRSLIDSIVSQGHTVSWHPGFYTFDNDDVYSKELIKIRHYLAKDKLGARHHFLRWKARESWAKMEQVGIIYDGSLGYSSCVGFRSSTARTYPAYDLLKDKPLSLIIKPLIVMDGVLLSSKSPSSILKVMKSRCFNVNGEFSILIHNYSIMSKSKLIRLIYKQLGCNH